MSEKLVLTPWSAPNKVLEDRYVVYAAIVLKNGQYAIGTVGKGAFNFVKRRSSYRRNKPTKWIIKQYHPIAF